MKLKIFLYVCLGFTLIGCSHSCPLDLKVCGTCDVVSNVSVIIENCGNFGEENQESARFEDNIANLTSQNVEMKHLRLVGVPLRTLKGAACTLVKLEILELENNFLRTISDGCFEGFKRIRRIQITRNKLRILQKGIFDGLENLEELDLRNNGIENINEEVFSNPSDLLKLRVIQLGGNKLTSVGAWIFLRPLATKNTNIFLSRNLISKFTNSFNWTFKCRDRPKGKLEMEIDLMRNKMEHISDLTSPYFKTLKDLICLLSKDDDGRTSFSLRSNPLVCDCVDYPLVILARSAPYSTMMDDTQCRKPTKFQDQKLMSIPLDELICSSEDDCVPGCMCTLQPSKSALHVNCSSRYKMDELPVSIPPTKLKNYYLRFDGNHFSRLTSRSYFDKANLLDLSYSKIKFISSNFLTSIKGIKDIRLHGNLLSSLPSDVCKSENFTFDKLTLHDNPWNCSCQNRWMKSWIEKNRGLLTFAEGMHCTEPHWLKGKSILTVDDPDFCSDPSVARQNKILATALAPVFCSVFVITLTFVLVRKFKIEIHARFSIHPFDRDECEGEHMLYDALISSSYQDRIFAIDLLRRLESKGYRVCYHERDFLVGPSIASNICRAVVYSKRVVCLLTADFLSSAYCMYEFQTALHRNIEIRKKRLIAILCEPDIISREGMTEDMLDFLKNHTYVEVREGNNWFDQLCYSLAVKKISNSLHDLSLLGSSETELVPTSASTSQSSLRT